MGLLSKLFGGKDHNGSVPPASSQIQEAADEAPDSAGDEAGGRSAPRRELVQVVLRDTMRKHGIPTDWIDCRILSVVSHKRTGGMHVQFVVRHGQETLLPYVYAFQQSFFAEISKFDPRAEEWLMSLAWQFEGQAGPSAAMPPPSTWGAAAGGAAAAAAAKAAPTGDSQSGEEDVEADLKALFAIRDAVLNAPEGDEPRDFMPTQPGFTDSERPR